MTFRLAVAATLAALTAAGCGGSERAPDLLLISVDTLRADRVSAYGAREGTTPILDGLAEGGVRFANAVAPSAQTAPSHMSIFTGVDPVAHGIRNVNATTTTPERVSKRLPMLPEFLMEAGYETAIVGDLGNVHPAYGFDRGFRHQAFESAGVLDKLDDVQAIFDRVDPDAPLFLFFHTYQVHAPYIPPAPWFGQRADPDYRGPFRERYDALASSEDAETHKGAGQFLEPFEGMGERDVAWLSALYDDNVAYTDDCLGALLDLWRRERGEQGWIVVFSDHGEEFMEHGRLGHRAGLSRALTHVPLIFTGPGVEPGVASGTVSLTGLGATLLELLEVPFEPIQENSFASLLTDPQQRSDSRTAYGQLLIGPKAGYFDAVTEGTTHVVRVRDERGTHLRRFELEQDPGGLGVLAVDPEAGWTELLDRRRLTNLELAEGYPTIALSPPSAERRRQLEALGYTGE